MSDVNYQKCINAITAIKSTYPTLLNDFNEWYQEGGWENDTLYDEFTESFEESAFIDWLTENNRIKSDKECLEIFSILNKAIKASSQQPQPQKPSNVQTTTSKTTTNDDEDKKYDESIIVNLLSVQISNEDKEEHILSPKSPTKQRIKQQSPFMFPQSGTSHGKLKKIFKKKPKEQTNTAQDLLHIELMGYKNDNYPLLIHFVDTFVRCQLNEWIQSGKKNGAPFSMSDFFETKCQNKYFQNYIKSHNSINLELVRTAIASYQKRVLPSFNFIDPVYKINANPLDIASYFFEIARIARNCANQPLHSFSNLIPMQIDFLMLNGKAIDSRPSASDCSGIKETFSDISDDEDEDDWNQNEEKSDGNKQEYVAKDIETLFKKKKIKFVTYQNPLRDMLRCTEDIKKMIENKRCQRINFVIDRRGKHKKKYVNGGNDGDKLYLYQSKKHNKFESNQQELIHAALHHNSISSIIPRMKSKSNDFEVRDALKGQMFVISWHILSKEEIRCYVFYQGMCLRFFGEDLINLLPIFFADATKVKELYMAKYTKDEKWRKAFDDFANTFVDKKFDLFYDGLIGTKPRMKVLE